MLIKKAADREGDIATLQALLARQDVSDSVRKRIEQEIRNIRAGAKGEAEAAYEIEFHHGASKNWAIIHDLRIECEGRVAQIDHLVINRFMDIWLCESKHFSEGIAINEHGECAAFYGGKAVGVPSPFEQNRKHAIVLESVFKSGLVKLPTRLGFAIKPSIKGLVLVSKNARISRPKDNGTADPIIKADQFKTHVDKTIDADNNPLGLAKMVSSETVEEFARALASIHAPVRFDWAAKFGLGAAAAAAVAPAEPRAVKPSPRTAATLVKSEPVQETQVQDEQVQEQAQDRPKQKLVCHACAEPIAYNVARFCWFNKQKFGGNIYCMECQKKV